MNDQLSLFDDASSEDSEQGAPEECIFSIKQMYALRLVEIGDFPTGERIQFRAPEDVAKLFYEYYKDKPTEEFFIVLLNTANVLIGIVRLSVGGLAASIVEPRSVFAAAIDGNAASIIAVHNHPSGNGEPSREDIRITRQLVEAGKIMGIPVHDHVIIAGLMFTSLAERGLIQ